MQLIDLNAQRERIKDKVEKRIASVLHAGNFIMGPEVFELEEKLAEFSGYANAITCASGTDALVLALKSLNVGPGDEVITTSFSFFATAESIVICGATPVFVDINPDTFNLNPDLIEDQITEKTKAVIAVGLYGQPAELSQISELCKKHNLKLIDDAAQSFGGLADNQSTAKYCDISCTSFFPAKPLGCYGDGGACFTNDPNTADLIRSLRVHGKGSDKYDNVRIGLNSRLDTIQAAILLEKLAIYENEIQMRQTVANYYHERLTGFVDTPQILPGYTSVWAQYCIKHRDREHITEQLKAAGIPTAIYYPKTLPQQGALKYLTDQTFPVAEQVSKEIFSIPMHPYLDTEQQDKVAEAIIQLT